MPEYRNEKIRYSHILEKYDSEWSQYSELTLKGYTKLKAGDYVFRVKAFNPIENRISETSFAFTILPPWYNSKLAIFIYFILILIITILGVKMLFRWKNATALKVKKEKELQMSELMRNAQETHLKKEQEITALKNKQLEYEMMAKSNELSGTTMNVIRKNELLADLTNQVDKIIGSIEDGNSSTATLKYLVKIRKQIKENIDHDNDWDKFANNFDIVYDNFIKRLKDQYPMLAHADLRLCAYLKMGLSSKEIAPLLNISIRSVETVRYRLRKKMGIDHTVNLSDYMQSY